MTQYPAPRDLVVLTGAAAEAAAAERRARRAAQGLPPASSVTLRQASAPVEPARPVRQIQASTARRYGWREGDTTTASQPFDSFDDARDWFLATYGGRHVAAFEAGYWARCDSENGA